MKKIRVFLVIIGLLISGCSRDNQLYVKNMLFDITGNQYSLMLYYYDFSQQDETYLEKTYTNEDIYMLAAEAMKDNNYSFRLCNNIFVTPPLWKDDINSVVYVVNSLRAAPSANLLFYTGENSSDMLTADSGDEINSPLYNLSLNEGRLSGILQIVDDNGKKQGKVIVKDGTAVDLIDSFHSDILDIVTNSVHRAQLTFRKESLWMSADNIFTGFYVKDNTLNIVVNMTLKERKGMGNTPESKRLFDHLRQTEISNAIHDLYDNIHINRLYNLHWYCVQSGTDCNDIKVEVNIN